MSGSDDLRAARDRILADTGLGGADFGRALSGALDRTCVASSRELELPGRWALAALGSYARHELCPGSDVDVMLLHDGGARGPAANAAAAALWYPLWDAGFVLGQALRTPREALSLARDDLKSLTALLDLRLIIGDAGLAGDVRTRARRETQKRRRRVIAAFARAAREREERPGPIAEMLEPNLKDGAGGLRDVQALGWAGWAIDEMGGVEALVRRGYLHEDDPAALDEARARFLESRVALQRITGGTSDVLTLQEQDAVAAALGVESADALVRDLARSSRRVSWIGTDAWRRLQRRQRFGGSRAHRLGGGVVVERGAAGLGADATVDAATVLRLCVAAAEHRVPIERATLERLRSLAPVEWTPTDREQFIRLLRTGRAAIPVVESLDEVGAFTALFPEWTQVRAKPQRNAYHRFTVDRHLLEAVAECAALLDDSGFDGDVARRTRPELLLLSALLHDLGKGIPGGDHSDTGAGAAFVIAERLGLDRHGADVVVWLVRNHLLLAETATRRDLEDEETIVRFGRAVGDTERLDLLYALTIGDSKATGPAAWTTGKAALMKQLFLETDSLLERGVVGPRREGDRRATLERHRELLARREVAVAWADRDDGLVECTVVAPDRTGMLATVSGVLAVHGFDIRGAAAYGDESGMALEVYRGVDVFGRLDATRRDEIARDVRSALAGELDVREQLDVRVARYRRPRAPTATAGSITVSFDVDASSAATICEVHAPDDVGLLARIAAVFADLDVDVTAALVSTLGDSVVDVFYMRDAQGAKLTDPATLERLRDTVFARLSADSLPA